MDSIRIERVTSSLLIPVINTPRTKIEYPVSSNNLIIHSGLINEKRQPLHNAEAAPSILAVSELLNNA